MCGEQFVVSQNTKWNKGSPPRVRGTGAATPLAALLFRITPACAGNSEYNEGWDDACKDHPRVCGEQARPRPSWDPFPGSPPRVRGTANSAVFLVCFARITPACAGNRGWMVGSSKMKKDHPRVCGEQEAGTSMKNVMEGSPPRVRGTVVNHSFLFLRLRITPACAGNRFRPARCS